MAANSPAATAAAVLMSTPRTFTCSNLAKQGRGCLQSVPLASSASTSSACSSKSVPPSARLTPQSCSTAPKAEAISCGGSQNKDLRSLRLPRQSPKFVTAAASVALSEPGESGLSKEEEEDYVVETESPGEKPIEWALSEVQTTIASPIEREGVGLHSGELATVRLVPAGPGEGRYFARILDCRDGNEAEEDDDDDNGREDIEREEEREVLIPCRVENVTDTQLSTALGTGKSKVQTIEHLMSALEGCGVDNVRIEIRGGPEVPLLDGSAKPWVDALLSSGIRPAVMPDAPSHDANVLERVGDDGAEQQEQQGEQSEEVSSQDHATTDAPSPRRPRLVISRPVVVRNKEAFVAAFPANEVRITYGIDFAQVPAIGRQWFSWAPGDEGGYGSVVAPARTFGILEQFEQLRAAGLIKGGSLDNALVCSIESGWVNPPLRFFEEPCRHKLLDLVGDLALLSRDGSPGLPQGHVVAFKASHSLHVQFARKLLEEFGHQWEPPQPQHEDDQQEQEKEKRETEQPGDGQTEEEEQLEAERRVTAEGKNKG